MPDQNNHETEPNTTMIYQIRVEGHLDSHWVGVFTGLTITHEDGGSTLLTGPVTDQAALHGLLRRIRDANMPLISVTRLQSDQADNSSRQ